MVARLTGRKAIIIFATNKYFILGLRLISHIQKHYKTENHLDYIFISDSDPKQYYDNKNIHHIPVSKDLSFMDIMILRWGYAAKVASWGIHDEIILIDADTSIKHDFTDSDFSSKFTTLLHPDNDDRDWMLNYTFEKNKKAAGYFKFADNEVYYNAAFLAASPSVSEDIYRKLLEWHRTDVRNDIQPPWHDETYINKYAHVYRIPEKIIDGKNSFLSLGDKGGKSLLTDLEHQSGVYVFDNARVINDVYRNALTSLTNLDIDSKWDILDDGTVYLVG